MVSFFFKKSNKFIFKFITVITLLVLCQWLVFRAKKASLIRTTPWYQLALPATVLMNYSLRKKKINLVLGVFFFLDKGSTTCSCQPTTAKCCHVDCCLLNGPANYYCCCTIAYFGPRQRKPMQPPLILSFLFSINYSEVSD